MSRVQQVHSFLIPAPDVIALVRAVATDMGYKVKREDLHSIVLTEPRSLSLFHNPAKIEMTVEPAEGGAIGRFRVTNFGIGPIQSAHVKGQLRELLAGVGRLLGHAQLMREGRTAFPPPGGGGPEP